MHPNTHTSDGKFKYFAIQLSWLLPSKLQQINTVNHVYDSLLKKGAIKFSWLLHSNCPRSSNWQILWLVNKIITIINFQSLKHTHTQTHVLRYVHTKRSSCYSTGWGVTAVTYAGHNLSRSFWLASHWITNSHKLSQSIRTETQQKMSNM